MLAYAGLLVDNHGSLDCVVNLVITLWVLERFCFCVGMARFSSLQTFFAGGLARPALLFLRLSEKS